MTKKPIAQQEPALPPERAIKAIAQQLEALEKLKGRRHDEAEKDETEWNHFTQSIVEAAFGNPSSSLSKFYGASSAGDHNIRGVSPRQRQINFQSRLNAFEALLPSLIKTLQLQLPEEDVKGVYEAGDEYGFYRDVSSLIVAAAQDILFVDAYLDEQLFNLYVSKVSSSAKVRILSNKIGANVETIAKKYASGCWAGTVFAIAPATFRAN